MAGNPWDPPLSASSVLGLQAKCESLCFLGVIPPCPALFYMGAGDQTRVLLFVRAAHYRLSNLPPAHCLCLEGVALLLCRLQSSLCSRSQGTPRSPTLHGIPNHASRMCSLSYFFWYCELTSVSLQSKDGTFREFGGSEASWGGCLLPS